MSATLLGWAVALGAGGILGNLARDLVAWARGRKGEEASAWAQRDREAKARRILEEHVHDLRLMLRDAGVAVPDWPEY